MQLSGSVARSTQAEPHGAKPSAQSMPHSPAVQVALPLAGIGHAMPHCPQLSGLAVVSMHEPLQFMRPPVQPALHAPRSQTSAAEQAISQSPQRARSEEHTSE